jgi:hypothetical protein
MSKSILDELPALRSQAAEEDEHKRMIVILSREMAEEDKAVFRQHGKVVEWSEKLLNISFSSLEFDYLLIDIRSKEARLTLGRQDLKDYNLVSYCFWVQKGVDEFINQLKAVAVSSIPSYAINKKDFEHMLLSPKISAPSVVGSFLRLVKDCVSGS